MTIESIKPLEYPYSFTSRAKATETIIGLQNESVSIGILERTRLHKISEFLAHPELSNLIDEGKITLGIIKPHVNEGKNLPAEDDDAAIEILNEIGNENIVFSFSTHLNENQVDDFYSDVKERYSQIAEESGVTVWDSISNFMRSGPLTFVLIYREEGNAVDWWRNKMGATKPNEASRNSIRGKYAIQEKLPNNITHGSDSAESVKKELFQLRKIVEHAEYQAINSESRFPTDYDLKELGVLSKDDDLVQITRIFDSGMRSESWIYGYALLYRDALGNIHQEYLKEKNIISMGGDIAFKAGLHKKRFEHLTRLGIPVPRTYGVRKAALYQEFIINDKTQEMYKLIRESNSQDQTENLLNQLINIAVKLDHAGYRVLGYLENLIFDGDRNIFMFTDTGGDLGEADSTSNGFYCKSTLENMFSKSKDVISRNYLELSKNLN